MTSPSSDTFTFLFTDIEGSTRLWQQHRQVMPAIIARHDALLREVVAAHRGSVFRTMGDAICAVFRTAPDALAATVQGQRALKRERWDDGVTLHVRMAIHTGAAEEHDGEYGGHTLNRVARLMSAASGGQILLSDVSRGLLLDEMPEELTLHDLGEHRLKDLERPEHIYQVEAPDLPRDFPPLHTLDAAPTNLPTPATSFVGRKAEIDALAAMLREPDVHLVTLVGPGGTGKTRLALHVSMRLLPEYADGVFFVPMAPIREPRLVASVIASALAVREAEDRPIEERLAEYLREKDLLLVLDNFEQIVASAPLLADLLAVCPRLAILVTSRSVLHLAAEHEYAVPPLSIPDPGNLPHVERLTQYDAVALFIQRARAIKPDFTMTSQNAPAVAEICHRLDGLPLAIELAAARIRLFSPESLLKRLTSSLAVLTGGPRDLPVRQQTLRGTIDWSYSLLSADQKRLFTRLAVFVGGWTLEAAEGVCSVEGDLDVLEEMSALVEQSLVRQDEAEEPRFSMLETIHEYTYEGLVASGEMDLLRLRHGSWFAESLPDAPDQVTNITTMVRVHQFFRHEQDNLRAAIQWSLEARDWTRYTALLKPLCTLWFTRGQWAEALSWTESIMPSVPPERTVERAAILFSAGFFLHRLGRYDAAADRLKEAISIQRELGCEEDLTTALYVLGELLVTRRDTRAAREVFEEALNTAGGRDSSSAPIILTHLGILARDEGEYDRARTYTLEGLEAARRTGDEIDIAVVLNSLADLARLEGNYDQAASIYEETASMASTAGYAFTLPGILHNLAYISHHRGDDARARMQFKEALGLYRDMGDRRGIAECVAGLATLDAGSNPTWATLLLAAATAAVESIGTRLSSSNQGEYDGAFSVIHSQLDGPAFEAAWAEGQRMTLDDAVARVMENTAGDPAAAIDSKLPSSIN